MILYPTAKINIGLYILRKNSNDYHEISSIFYPLTEVFDILEIIESDNFQFSTSGISIPGNQNSCEDAFMLLKNQYNIKPVSIHLHKQIPVGAGLGGGSADASFCLKASFYLADPSLS